MKWKPSDDSFIEEKPFKSEAAPKAYHVFRKFDVFICIKVSILSIARLDAIVAWIIYSFQDQFDGSRTRSPSRSAIAAKKDFDYFSFSASAEKEKHSRREGRKPLDSNRSFKRYMPAAISALIALCCDEYFCERKSRGFDQIDLRFVSTDQKWVTRPVDLGTTLSKFLAVTQWY